MSLQTWLLVVALAVQIIELGLISYIAWEGHQTLKVERENLSLYQNYFNERVRWRQEKRKQRENLKEAIDDPSNRS